MEIPHRFRNDFPVVRLTKYHYYSGGNGCEIRRKWRYSHESDKGEKYAFYGEYQGLKEPEFITWTFNFEPIGSDHEVVETVSFEEVEEGKTKLTTVSHFKNVEDLTGMVESGMESDAELTWDGLEELLQK